MPQELVKEKAQEDLKKLVEEGKKSAMTPEEKTKLEAEAKKAKEAEDKAKQQKAQEDAILAKKPEELTDDEKKMSEAITKQREEAEAKKQEEEESKLSESEKIKRIQEKTQKRIDEITSELKETRNKSEEEVTRLRQEMEALKIENESLKKPPQADVKDKLKSLAQEREKLYLQEDASLPREERREMSKEELDEWYLEDSVAVTEWIQKRIMRKDKESELDRKRLIADDLLSKQKESLKKTFIRHPDLNIEAKVKALKAQGKSDSEIREALKDSIKKAGILAEITNENPSYLGDPDGPEKAVAEMEKRLSSTPKNEPNPEVDELTKKVEELSATIAKLTSDEGINSSISSRSRDEQKLTAQEQDLVSTMKSAGADKEHIDSALKKFRTSKGR